MKISIIGTIEIDGNERTGIFLEGDMADIKLNALLFRQEVKIVKVDDPAVEASEVR